MLTVGGAKPAPEAGLGGAEVNAMSARGLVSDIEQTSFSVEQPKFSGVQVVPLLNCPLRHV